MQEFASFNVAAVTTAAAAAQRITPAAEFVDLSAEPARAQIVRQGFEVPQVTFDPKKLDQFIGTLPEIPIAALPRVLSQNIPPGTKVPAGTVVDLVLAPRGIIPFAVLDNVHADLAAKNLDAIDGLYADQTARKTLLTYATADQVPAAERNHLQAALQAVGVTVDDTSVDKTFAKAFNSARGGLAFQG